MSVFASRVNSDAFAAAASFSLDFRGNLAHGRSMFSSRGSSIHAARCGCGENYLPIARGSWAEQGKDLMGLCLKTQNSFNILLPTQYEKKVSQRK